MTLNEIATKLGLTAIGIADTKSPPPELAHLNDWLKAGYNGKMAFLARDPERRCDIKQIMPECKTVIVAAMKYDKMPAKPASMVEANSCPLHGSSNSMARADFGSLSSFLKWQNTLMISA